MRHSGRPVRVAVAALLSAALVTACSQPTVDEDAVAAACDSLIDKVERDDITPEQVVSESGELHNLRSSDEDRLLEAVQDTCPFAWSAAVNTQGMTFSGPPPGPSEQERADTLAGMSRQVVGPTAEQELLDAVASITEYYCDHGADDDAQIGMLVQVALDGIEQFTPARQEWGGLDAHAEAWDDDGIRAFAALLPLDGRIGRGGLEVPGSRWSDMALTYCKWSR